MAVEIKRNAELVLVALLSEALPDFDFYSSKGGDDDGGITYPRPPFGVVTISENEKKMHQENTWLLTGTVIWITRADLTDVSDHADAVKQIGDFLNTIVRGSDLERGILVHGLDVFKTDEYTDEARQAHGDTFYFTMGVTEFPR